MSTVNKNVLYIGGIDGSISKQLMHAAFIPFGDIVDITIPVDEKREPRGYGFVEFESAEDAAAALENMNLGELNGRVLNISYAKPMQHQNVGVVLPDEQQTVALDTHSERPTRANDLQPRKKRQKN